MSRGSVLDMALAPKFDRYEQTFQTFGEHGLKLGPDVKVTVREIFAVKRPRTNVVGDVIASLPQETPLRIRATLELESLVCVSRPPSPGFRCSLCEKEPPLPDDDALWFMLVNGDGDRLYFPYEEDCEDERDRYPVAGWVRDRDEGLLCGDCAGELEAAKKTIAAKRRRRKNRRAQRPAEATPTRCRAVWDDKGRQREWWCKRPPNHEGPHIVVDAEHGEVKW